GAEAVHARLAARGEAEMNERGGVARADRFRVEIQLEQPAGRAARWCNGEAGNQSERAEHQRNGLKSEERAPICGGNRSLRLPSRSSSITSRPSDCDDVRATRNCALKRMPAV